MDLFNLLTVAAASPPIHLANPKANAATISSCCKEAAEKGVDLLLFPDLCITGASCGDLFGQPVLLKAAHQALEELTKSSQDWPGLVAVVGLPAVFPGGPAKATAVIQAGSLLTLFPQPLSPQADKPGPALFPASFCCESPPPLDLVFSGGRRVRLSFSTTHPSPGPAALAARAAATRTDLLLIPAAYPLHPDSSTALAKKLTALSELAGAAVLYSEAGPGESTGDNIYAGQGLLTEAGSLLWQCEPFANTAGEICPQVIDLDVIRQGRQTVTDLSQCPPFTPLNRPLKEPDDAYRSTLLNRRRVSPHPFVPADAQARKDFCRTVLEMQARGLAGRLTHLNKPKSIIGISGGLDSTLALLVTCRAYRLLGLTADHIVGVSMPGFGTTKGTQSNAHQLMAELNVEALDIPISEAVNLHFRDIGHDPSVQDITYENAQARERTQILMDLANRCGGLVIGTGDLSELALGWCTYNGDQMSMYGVNAGVPKTLIRHILQTIIEDLKSGQSHYYQKVEADAGEANDLLDEGANRRAHKERHIADLLEKILATPISPELLPPNEKGEIVQHTEDTTGPYELHDFFIYNAVRQAFSPAKVYQLAKTAFAQAVPASKTEVGVTAYDAATIKKWLIVFYRRFFSQQFKRSALPDSPQIFDFSLAARGDRVLPADAKPDLWLHLLEEAVKEDAKKL